MPLMWVARLMQRCREQGRQDDAGFTLVELVVAMGIFLVIILIMGDVLTSLTRASARGDALVTNEQQEMFAVTQIGRDLRGAAYIVTAPTTTGGQPTPTTWYFNQLVMSEVNPTGGAQTTVGWVFNPTSQDLCRDILSSPAATLPACDGTTSSNQRYVLTSVKNTPCTSTTTLSSSPPCQPLFKLYDQNAVSGAADLVTQSQSNSAVTLGIISQCTDRVAVTVVSAINPGPQPIEVDEDFELPNQFSGPLGNQIQCP
ncbi:MAG TPA: prepilin-type N-terminal cleavage/methylation domain-containing protein [Acidimicrobiales bacterium]|nr:prepilin-type N-terminal cleavage/methylation domain-containing protein [Acidimicrobiales bacterium]